MKFLFLGIFVLFLITSALANTAPVPTAPGVIQAFVPSPQKMLGPRQQTQYTCWAASLSNYLRFYDIDWPEAQIVQQIKPGVPFGPGLYGQPQELTPLLNHSWVDANGTHFTLSSKITDNWTHSRTDITNNDMEIALAAGQPIYFCDAWHSMIMICGYFSPVPGGFKPENDGIVIDPDPPGGNTSVIRHLRVTPQINELLGKYAAIITVTKP